ncbi:ubiquitin-2 like Rad60 SUMO-like-domain-containing protein [Circinella umbellata]|nr:ubiquitin-2 like Rad60 SUMO-like-domain-containing protein [Circinella umbellata]
MADFDICDIYSHRRSTTKKKTKGKKVIKKQQEKKRKSQFEEILKTRAKLGVDGSRSDSNDDSDSDDHGRSKKKTKLLFSDLNKRLNSQQSTQELDSKNDYLGLTDEENNINNNSYDENNNINNDETTTVTTEDTSFSLMDSCESIKNTPDIDNNAFIELSDDDGKMDERSTSFPDYSLSSSSSPMHGINYQPSPEKPRMKPLPVIPSIEELTDLDPDLMRLATTSSNATATDGTSLNDRNDNNLLPTKLEKVRVTVQYVPLMKTTDENILEMMRILSEPIKAILMENDPFDKLLQYFCSKKYLKKEDVILVYEGIPVMLRATPQSLNMITGVKAKNLMKAYKKDDYEKQEREKSENLKRRLEETPFDDKFMNNLKQVQPSEPVESESFIRIKLRGKNNEDTNMRVKQTTSLRTIVNRYAELQALANDAATKIRLSFDGEDLSLDDTIGDTELEDEDVVEVIIS